MMLQHSAKWRIYVKIDKKKKKIIIVKKSMESSNKLELGLGTQS